MDNTYVISHGELYHHGTKGMRWGVRRYQNKDGSLTPAGKKRYNDSDNANNNSTTHEDYTKAHTRKNVRNMSTAELNERNQRLEAEKKYNSLSPKEKSKLEKTKDTVDEVSKAVNSVKDLERNTRPKSTKVKLDLTSMSDKEMRDAINREMLERQYNEMFAPETKVSKGREAVQKTLAVAGGVVAATGTALQIALAIKQLRE